MNLSILHEKRGVAVETFTATEAQSAFGQVMERALSKGMVAITKFNKPKLVVLSMEAYRALEDQAQAKPVGRFDSDEFLAQLQTPKAKTVLRSIFTAEPREFGKAAVKGAQRKHGAK